MIRADYEDLIFATEEAKFKSIIDEIKERQATGQPILVGTVAIETSERLSKALKRVGIEHPSVVRCAAAGARIGRRIAWIHAGHDAEQSRRIGDRAGHRPRCILTGRNRNDPRAADESDGGFQSDDSTVRRR